MEAVADADEAGEETQPPQAPGFGERGRMRRRARFLRKARELAYRDLGGLVFDLHRFGQRNDPLVLAKLATLRQIDTEVRELEAVLRERRPVTVLREVGIAACPRCAAIHGSDDRFCPGCGLAFDAKADRPISTAPVNHQGRPTVPATTAPAPGDAPTGSSAPATAPHPRRRQALSRHGASPGSPPPSTDHPPPPHSLYDRSWRPRRHRSVLRSRRGRTDADPATAGIGPVSPGPLVTEACPLCGSALRPEQSWCLRCGAAARTRLAAQPKWKALAGAFVAIVVVSLGVLAAALVQLAG